jgi:POT family proton-dependent oligopeptide transporter
MFKPNISTLVGNLYNNDQYRPNKDAGYNIFYMGINVGAFMCNFVAAYMRLNYGWGYAFAAAGVGMLIGVATFLIGTKHIKEADVIKPLQEGDMSTAKILLSTVVPMFIFGVIGYLIPGNLLGTDTNDAFIVGCIPIIGFFIYLSFTAPKQDRRPISALLAVFACIVVFWAIFHQNGDALTIWAEEYTDREMPVAVSGIADSIGMVQTVTNLGESSDEKSLKYFENLSSDKIPAEGSSLKLFSTELYQSINPFWVVLLTPILVGFWGLLRSRKSEPSTPTKIAIGLFITALSALVMVGAVEATNHLEDKASSWWLIASYGVITIGELCLSPMGLSLVSKLSPPRITALMMGGFFLSTSVGNKLSGMLSGLWEGIENKSHFFYMNFALVMAAAVLLFAMLKWINGVMKEKNVY